MIECVLTPELLRRIHRS